MSNTNGTTKTLFRARVFVVSMRAALLAAHTTTNKSRRMSMCHMENECCTASSQQQHSRKKNTPKTLQNSRNFPNKKKHEEKTKNGKMSSVCYELVLNWHTYTLNRLYLHVAMRGRKIVVHFLILQHSTANNISKNTHSLSLSRVCAHTQRKCSR